MVRKFIINIVFILTTLVGYSQHNFFFNQHYGQDDAPIAPPVVATLDAQSITSTSAALHGEAIDPGGETPSILGVVYATHINPTTSDSYGGGSWALGVYWVNATNLQPNTTYYYRAFAENTGGTSYGEQKSFTTLPVGSIPIVVLDSINYAIGITKAHFYGNVTNSGGSTVTERGFVINEVGNPSTNDIKLVTGSGTGLFDNIKYNLDCGITYYVKAYAINSLGTAYSDEMSFVLDASNLPLKYAWFSVFNDCAYYNVKEMSLSEIEEALSVLRNCPDVAWGNNGYSIRLVSITLGEQAYVYDGCGIWDYTGYFLFYIINIHDEPLIVVKFENGIITEIHYR